MSVPHSWPTGTNPRSGMPRLLEAQATLPGQLAMLAAPDSPDNLPPIDDLDERFVQAYLTLPDATKAYLKVMPHVTRASARVLGWKKLRDPAIQQHISFERRARAIRTDVTIDKVLSWIATLADSSIDNYKINEDGYIELQPWAPEEALKAISQVKRTRTVNPVTGEVSVHTEFKLWDKPTMVRAAGQHLGMFIERGINVNFTLEDMMRAIAEGKSMDDIMKMLPGHAVTHSSSDEVPSP